MARFGESARCFRVQFVFQKQQLFVKMRDGRILRASVLAAVGKRAGDPDRADRVQPVRVLYDLAFQRFRALVAILAEGHGIDCLADALDLLRRDLPRGQGRARVGVTFRLKQLVVIGVVQQRRERDNLRVAAGLPLCNAQGVLVHAQAVRGVVPAEIAAKQVLYVGDCR